MTGIVLRKRVWCGDKLLLWEF